MKPTNEELRIIFDEVAPRYEEISNPYTTFRRREIIMARAKGDCLEVGAGSGELASLLAQKYNVTATDISPKMVDEIRKRQVKAVVSDAEKLPFKESSFDTVIAAELIYYLDHPERFIAESWRVLKTGGRLLISSANNMAKIYDRGRGLFRIIGFSHMYFDDRVRDFMTGTRLRRLLGEQGFVIKEEKKILVLPFRKLDWIGRILENTPLKHFGIFTFIMAEKL